MIYKSSAAYSFPKAGKVPESNLISKSKKNNPPPGYHIGDLITKPKKGFVFSKEEKLKHKINKTPACTKYDGAQKGLFGSGTPHYSFAPKNGSFAPRETEIGERVRKSTRERNKTPFAKDYYITNDMLEKTSKSRTRHVVMKGSSKTLDYDNKVPGVGRYDITRNSTAFGKSNKGKYSMGKSSRSSIIDRARAKTPGPRETDTQPRSFGYCGSKFSFGKRTEIKRPQTPGPGAYNSDNAKNKTLRSTPSIGIGFGKRSDQFGKKNRIGEKDPGPGCYTLPSEFNIKNASRIKGYSFGKDERMEHSFYKRETVGDGVCRPKTPGPGLYRIPTAFAHVPLYSGITSKYHFV